MPAILLCVELTWKKTLLWLPGAAKPELIGIVKSLVSKPSKVKISVPFSVQIPEYETSNISGPLPVLVIDTVASWVTLPNKVVVPSELKDTPKSWLTVIFASKKASSKPDTVAITLNHTVSTASASLGAVTPILTDVEVSLGMDLDQVDSLL